MAISVRIREYECYLRRRFIGARAHKRSRSICFSQISSLDFFQIAHFVFLPLIHLIPCLSFSLWLFISYISGAMHPKEDRKRLRHSRDCCEFVIALVNAPRWISLDKPRKIQRFYASRTLRRSQNLPRLITQWVKDGLRHLRSDYVSRSLILRNPEVVLGNRLNIEISQGMIYL